MTQKELKALVSYDPDSGVFTWLNPSKAMTRVKSGDVAGGSAGNGYLGIKLHGKRYFSHRLAWLYVYGEPPQKGALIDHVNGDKSDNRIDNLRLATKSQNAMNMGVTQSNKTGVKGVSFSKERNKFRAQIMVRYKQINLGYFDSVDDAKKAYESASLLYHGEFGRAMATP